MKIFIAGHKGMVGSAIFEKLKNRTGIQVHTVEKNMLNLLDQTRVFEYLSYYNFDVVINCAAKVGGIYSNNTYRANFIYENIQIQNNLIHGSYISDVKKFLFLGSSCIYPKFAEQPIKEEYLLTYAIAKISGIKMCESYYKQYGCNFISVMPTNLYGPNDNFHPQNSHVLPALLHKFHLAKIKNEPFVEIWGTGKAKREFMHVNDMADACLHVLDNVQAKDLYSQNISQINIGSGEEISIHELAHSIAKAINYSGEIKFDLTKPDGTLRKLLDSTRLKKLGFTPKIKIEEGLKHTYNWYLNNQDKLKI